MEGSFDIEAWDLNYDRFDTDLYLSYKFFQAYFSLAVGYKFIQYDTEYKDVKVSGFGLGVAGAIPIKAGFYGYYIARNSRYNVL